MPGQRDLLPAGGGGKQLARAGEGESRKKIGRRESARAYRTTYEKSERKLAGEARAPPPHPAGVFSFLDDAPVASRQPGTQSKKPSSGYYYEIPMYIVASIS